jgi:hypothetical protein
MKGGRSVVALAVFERNLIGELTWEGLPTARGLYKRRETMKWR